MSKSFRYILLMSFTISLSASASPLTDAASIIRGQAEIGKDLGALGATGRTQIVYKTVSDAGCVCSRTSASNSFRSPLGEVDRYVTLEGEAFSRHDVYNLNLPDREFLSASSQCQVAANQCQEDVKSLIGTKIPVEIPLDEQKESDTGLKTGNQGIEGIDLTGAQKSNAENATLRSAR